MLFPSVHLTTVTNLSQQAKESWEMDTKEKLEQAAIVKEKGTVYFKVCESLYNPFISRDLLKGQWIVLIIPTLNFVGTLLDKSKPEFLQICNF